MTRHVELVQLSTEDKLRLPGAFFESATPAPSAAVDAVLLCCGPFHQPFVTVPAEALAKVGYPVLTMSTRTAEVLSVSGGRAYTGTAYEVMPECVPDFDAGIGWLVDRGFRRIAAFGHSSPATKMLYYAAHAPHEALAAVIASAGPRWSASAYAASAYAADFARNRDRAQAMVDEGRGRDLFEMDFPAGPQWISAASYLDKFGSDQYDVAKWAEKINVPILRVDAEHDLAPGTVNELLMVGVADDLLRLTASGSRYSQAVVVPGADHVYSSGQQGLIDAVLHWLAGLPAGNPRNPRSPA